MSPFSKTRSYLFEPANISQLPSGLPSIHIETVVCAPASELKSIPLISTFALLNSPASPTCPSLFTPTLPFTAVGASPLKFISPASVALDGVKLVSSVATGASFVSIELISVVFWTNTSDVAAGLTFSTISSSKTGAL